MTGVAGLGVGEGGIEVFDAIGGLIGVDGGGIRVTGCRDRGTNNIRERDWVEITRWRRDSSYRRSDWSWRNRCRNRGMRITLWHRGNRSRLGSLKLVSMEMLMVSV